MSGRHKQQLILDITLSKSHMTTKNLPESRTILSETLKSSLSIELLYSTSKSVSHLEVCLVVGCCSGEPLTDS